MENHASVNLAQRGLIYESPFSWSPDIGDSSVTRSEKRSSLREIRLPIDVQSALSFDNANASLVRRRASSGARERFKELQGKQSRFLARSTREFQKQKSVSETPRLFTVYLPTDKAKERSFRINYGRPGIKVSSRWTFRRRISSSARRTGIYLKTLITAIAREK